MDFASTLRVLAKHKIFVGFMLLLTLGGTAWALLQSAQTKEAAGSYVLLSAPAVPENAAGVPEEVVNNPYSAMEKSTVVDILVKAMATQQVATELKDEGLVGTYRVAGNQDFIRGPLFDMFVTSPTEEEALRGYGLLVDQLNETLRENQIGAGAKEPYLITTQEVSTPVVSTPGLVGRVRTGIVLLAVGVILTVGLTLALESVTERRRKAKAERGPEPEKLSRKERRRARRDWAEGQASDSPVEPADVAPVQPTPTVPPPAAAPEAPPWPAPDPASPGDLRPDPVIADGVSRSVAPENPFGQGRPRTSGTVPPGASPLESADGASSRDMTRASWQVPPDVTSERRSD